MKPCSALVMMRGRHLHAHATVALGDAPLLSPVSFLCSFILWGRLPAPRGVQALVHDQLRLASWGQGSKHLPEVLGHALQYRRWG